ncbi:MAG: hypothetical protein ACRC7N_14525 [Clostridium sp.]
MEKINLLKKEHEEYLNSLMELHKNEEERLKANDLKDESVFEKIKYNVVEIFHKMFIVSCTKGLKSNNIQEVNDTYKTYYNNIPRGWRERLKQAQKLNVVEDIVVEELKLKQLDEIFDAFEISFNKYKN